MRFAEVASLPMMRRKLETEVHGSAARGRMRHPLLATTGSYDRPWPTPRQRPRSRSSHGCQPRTPAVAAHSSHGRMWQWGN